MNYRHSFHAGNFADLVKHAALMLMLRELTAEAAPLTVIDTHAGRGLYDLAGPEALRSGEAEAGASFAAISLATPASASPDRSASGPARS